MSQLTESSQTEILSFHLNCSFGTFAISRSVRGLNCHTLIIIYCFFFLEGRILGICFFGDYMTVYGVFAITGPIIDQMLSKSRLMGPVWRKQCSYEILSLKKFHEIICFICLFCSTLKVIKFGFAKDLGGIIQFCLGYRLSS